MKPAPRTLLAGVLGAALVLGAAACSDDGGGSSSESSTDKAQSQVCDDAGSFKDSVNKLVDDVKSGNFGDASDQLSTVESSFQALEKSVKNLSSDKKSDVQGDVDSAKKTLGDLSDANSLDDLQDTLDKAESQLKDAADSITDTISC